MPLAASYPDINIKRDFLIYPAAIWITAYAFMSRTNFAHNWNAIYGMPLKLENICRIIIIFYAVYNAVREENRGWKALYLGVILLGFITSNILFMLWAALAGRSMKNWLSIGVGVYTTMFGLTMVASVVGFIGSGTHGAWEGTFLGMETQGQFGFVLLFLMLQVTVLRQGRFKYYEYAAMAIIIFLNSHFYTRRNPNICMTVLLLMLIGREIYIRLRAGKGTGKLVSALQTYLFDYTFLIAYVAFVVSVFMRNYIRLLQPKLPWLRSLILRLDDTAEIWRAFPPTLLGRAIRDYNGKNATVLLFDPQFSSTLLYDGIIVLVVMILISTYFMVKAHHKGEGAMYIAFMVMALFSISDPVAWSVSLNFLIALPFACWDITCTAEPSLVFPRSMTAENLRETVHRNNQEK